MLYSPFELGLTYFDNNYCRILSHILGSSVERDTWNVHPHRIHLLNMVLPTLTIITAVYFLTDFVVALNATHGMLIHVVFTF